MHNIFNGLIWFVLPCCLVFCNDITAYITGMLYGRKFIRRPFLSVSPNKTWEGFLGGWFFTMIAAWYLARFLSQFTWMTCPTNEFRIFPQKLSCATDPIFAPAMVSIHMVPSQLLELLPANMVKMIPNIVQICSTITGDDDGDGVNQNGALSALGELTRCVSGESHNQVHHHFEWTIQDYYPIQVHAVWLGLFASLVAPFGGFLASAIKRAYGIKDFDSIIPGEFECLRVCFAVVVVLCLPTIDCQFTNTCGFARQPKSKPRSRRSHGPHGLPVSHGPLYVGPLQHICQAGHRERSQVDVHVLFAFGAREERLFVKYFDGEIETESGGLFGLKSSGDASMCIAPPSKHNIDTACNRRANNARKFRAILFSGRNLRSTNHWSSCTSGLLLEWDSIRVFNGLSTRECFL
jgi:CDP-diglyceride synthetase